ncbi:hypothetical protein [Hydrogenophaga palleronii]|uniref:hypothetical protein n=1 Tax=Hydrogenophaga palleronii TaxID=65655 RepID=UPI000A54C867|nr:hypothetical protein [Hydrogenophaga palleronii]
MIHRSIARALAIAATLLAACGEALAGAEGAAPVSGRKEEASYRNGTYTAEGLYGGLPSRLTVTLTLAADRIQAVSVRTHATDPTSLDYQRRFAEAVPALVKGRPIADVQISKLAGSSVTPDGFNEALARIREQARRR